MVSLFKVKVRIEKLVVAFRIVAAETDLMHCSSFEPEPHAHPKKRKAQVLWGLKYLVF